MLPLGPFSTPGMPEAGRPPGYNERRFGLELFGDWLPVGGNRLRGLRSAPGYPAASRWQRRQSALLPMLQGSHACGNFGDRRVG